MNNNSIARSLQFTTHHYDSWLGESQESISVSCTSLPKSWHNGNDASQLAFSDLHQQVIEDWWEVLLNPEAIRVLNEYCAKCQHQSWTAHPDVWQIVLTAEDDEMLNWNGDSGSLGEIIPDGIVRELSQSLNAAVNNEAAVQVPEQYILDLDLVGYEKKGRGSRGALNDLMDKVNLETWEENPTKWWEQCRAEHEFGSMMVTLEGNNIDWRKGLKDEQIVEIEERWQRINPNEGS